MYVDDCLSSVTTEEAAKSLFHAMYYLFQISGFSLIKFLSYSLDILQSISKGNRAKDIEKWNLSDDRHTLVYCRRETWFICKQQ